jgi:hypothetical protein
MIYSMDWLLIAMKSLKTLEGIGLISIGLVIVFLFGLIGFVGLIIAVALFEWRNRRRKSKKASVLAPVAAS